MFIRKSSRLFVLLLACTLTGVLIYKANNRTEIDKQQLKQSPQEGPSCEETLEEWNAPPDPSWPRVPFFIHEPPSLSALLEEECPAASWIRGNPCATLPEYWRTTKKGREKLQLVAEVFWLRNAATHPWRVTDAALAEAFVIPLMPTVLAKGGCSNASLALSAQVCKEVMATHWWRRRQGRDHILVGSDWEMYRWKSEYLHPEFARMTRRTVLGHYKVLVRRQRSADLEGNCIISLPYTHLPPAISHTDFVQWKSRLYTLFFQGRSARKANYMYRRLALRHLAGKMSPSVLVSTNENSLPRCEDIGNLEGCLGAYDARKFGERLTNSKYCLMARGDDASSARFYSAFRQQAINVLVSDRAALIFMPFQCRIPYSEIMVTITEKEFREGPFEAMQKHVLSLDEEQLSKMWHGMMEARKELLWNIPQNNVVSNVLMEMQRQCMPLDQRSTEWGSKTLALLARQCPYPDLKLKQNLSASLC